MNKIEENKQKTEKETVIVRKVSKTRPLFEFYMNEIGHFQLFGYKNLSEFMKRKGVNYKIRDGKSIHE